MRERPILFSAPMVRAILAGTKMQTRRVAKGVVAQHSRTGEALSKLDSAGPRAPCPYGAIGDRLWVRETWNQFDGWAGYRYAADYDGWGIGPDDDPDHVPDHAVRWRPSIHMPRAASRITLEITAVRVERLQDISESDAQEEGCALECMTPTGDDNGSAIYGHSGFMNLWKSINGTESWESNPWVWVIEFKRVETEVA